MKRMIMLFSFLLGLSSMALAQGTGEVWGTVVDSKTGITIPGVNVYVKNGVSLIGTATDSLGKFRLKSLPSGTYTLIFTCMGYGEGKMEQVVVYAESIKKVGEYLMTPGLELSPVVISAEKVIGTDVVPRMTSKDLAHTAGNKDLKQMISNITADVTKTDDGALYFRGARDNDFVYYVDGVKIKADDAKIPCTAIGSMQVYTGGVPARYGDFTGGCVVIETQSYFSWLNSQN